jgi:CheY-like chemotaxis protein
MARILIIDDDDTVRLSLKMLLEDAEYEVVEADDGEAGLECMRENPADLVISDIFMPKKEGIETIDELRREFPHVRIIAISGGGRMDPDAYLDIARRVGADASLFKPFDMKVLLNMVERLLADR